MKILNKVIQFVIGFFSIMFLWVIGALFNTPSVDMWCHENIDTEELLFSCIMPMATVILIPVLLLVFSVICKRKSLKVMYISALIATIFPIFSRVLLMIFSNDGSVLTWIFGLTIGLVLYPFGRMAMELFDGVSSFYYVYLGGFIDDSTIIGFLVMAIVISLIMYKKIKAKKVKDTD